MDYFGNTNSIYNRPPLQNPNPTEQFRFCKLVDSLNSITPVEIPTDGSWGIFVIQDLSAVYLIRNTLEGVVIKDYPLKEPISIKANVPQITMDDIQALIDENNKKMRNEFRQMLGRNRNKGGQKNE